MLVLTRNVNESIVIGDTIRVTVTDLGRGRVRLAIDAPKNVRIVRSEIQERENAEDVDSSQRA